MGLHRSLDALVQYRLKSWPNRPPGLPNVGKDAWLRGRPGSADTSNHPFLKLPGSDRMRTLPDGLWLNFGGTVREPYVDIFAIEACSTLQNLLDKRSRFSASTHSLLAVCPVPWLHSPMAPNDSTQRWRATGVIDAPPQGALVVPVRDMRVMYGLKSRHYDGFAASQVPHAHEYFVPMEQLTAEDALENPGMQDMIRRAAISANFFPIDAAQPRQPCLGALW